MMEQLQYLNGIMLIISCGFLLIFFLASVREKESRAAVAALLLLAGNTALWSLFLLSNSPALITVNWATLALFALFALTAPIRFFPPLPERDLRNAQRMDERDIMFSRNMLKFNPLLAEKYYAAHPQKRETDRLIHEKPEIGESGALFYDPCYSPIFDAAFTYLDKTRSASDGEPAPETAAVDETKIMRTLRELCLYYGAADVGFVRLQPHHLYSHSGRRPENWGAEIKLSHTHAAIIIVPMRVDMMKEAPALQAILESSRIYVESAKIAHIAAEFLRISGYSARSHTDGNYLVLCSALAVDAGIGALSRMGVFLHPIHGPCVRIAAVTTNLPLSPATHHPHIPSIHHFCKICKKCARNCPTQAIENNEEPESRGFRHWSINQEACFSFWKTTGADCGFCIRVCPYTKPNTLIHKLVRWYISRNPINQHIALLMDDFFYGRSFPIPHQKPKHFSLK